MLYPIKREGRYGYMDAGGRLAVKPTYLYCRPFTDGLGCASQRHSYTFFKGDGTIAFVTRVGWCGHFSEGKCGYSNEPIGDGKQGFMDQAGREVIPCVYDKVYPFSDGVAAAGVGEKIGLIDHQGRWVLQPQNYSYVGPFASGLAPCCTIDGDWGYINLQGELIVELKYDRTFPAAEGLLLVCDRKAYGFMSLDGEWAIEPRFRNAMSFSEGFAACADRNRRWAFISKAGEFVHEPSFVQLNQLSEGLAAACVEGFRIPGEIVDAKWDSVRNSLQKGGRGRRPENHDKP